MLLQPGCYALHSGTCYRGAGVKLERPSGEAGGDLRIRARAYSLSLGENPHFISLDDASGRRWADLFLGAAVDTREEPDATTLIGAPTVAPLADGWRIIVPMSSTAWTSKRLVFDCQEDFVQAYVEVEGGGAITDCHLFGGDYSGDLRRGIGF